MTDPVTVMDLDVEVILVSISSWLTILADSARDVFEVVYELVME